MWVTAAGFQVLSGASSRSFCQWRVVQL